MAAADQNLIPPLLALAEIYLQPPNSTITADIAQAMHFYQRAADLGSAPAQVALGTIFSKGLLGKSDYNQAVGWYKRAADTGEPDGEFALGVSYAMGHGVAVDYGLARRWLTAAANQGQLEAQYDLAIICEQGNGAPPDREMAAHYYQMAAERGMAKAQYRYGLMLAKGTSGGDRINAYKWLALAQNAIKESSPALSDVKKNMSPQEIAQAEQDLSSWRSAHGLSKR
jgi:TPR repeat protein